MTIPTDIVLAFILLVMFNFLMNLFLFYKWHHANKELDEFASYCDCYMNRMGSGTSHPLN
jgi:hypothetical protein